jgi:hypothetical protein
MPAMQASRSPARRPLRLPRVGGVMRHSGFHGGGGFHATANTRCVRLRLRCVALLVLLPGYRAYYPSVATRLE